MDVMIRNERPGDYRETEEVTREAFWNVHEPGCCEHYLAHLMRERPEFIRELDFVAVRDGRTVDLTAKEYDLIELLMRNPRRVYSRENLMNVVWGYSYAGDYRTVDVHIRRLREKLEKNPAEPDHIMTKWGVGYYFKP